MVCVIIVFFFKQKTAYEVRISDWSSDVCSSDLGRNYRSNARPGSSHIDRQGLLMGFEALPADRPDPVRPAGVVDEDVDPAGPRDDGIDRGLPHRRIGHVETKEACSAANVPRDGLAALDIDVAQEHGCAIDRKSTRLNSSH